MPFSLQTAATLNEAANAVAAGARYMAGGTLVVRAANEGDLSITRIVRSIDPALTAIEVSNGLITIGASVTMAAVARHPALTPLAKVARAVGGPAVRNMATVGGNLFAPSPYGDFAVALLALDATVLIRGKELAIDEFLLVREDLAGKEIVDAVRFALPAEGTFRFIKVSRVKPKGVSVLSIAAAIELGAKGTISRAKIALGSMADRPIRAKAAEQALVGKPLNQGGIADALAAAATGLSPPTDAIASAWYRAEVLPVHLGRLLLS
jgi:CO/xanthine dehydrogenase FAD-binding subunit